MRSNRIVCRVGAGAVFAVVAGFVVGHYSSWEYGSSSNLSRAQAKEVPQFDCFSRPAIAAGILRQEADRCLLEYERARDWQARVTQEQNAKGTPGASGSQVDLISGPRQAQPWKSGAGRMVPPINRVRELTKGITDLKNDLDRKLMLVYFENNLSNQFLDCYLNQLQEAPDGNSVVWARYALECSRTCGRTAELLDAMRHLIQFRQEIKGLKGLQAALDDWVSHNSGAQDASSR